MILCSICETIELPNRRFKYCLQCRLEKRRTEFRTWYELNRDTQRERMREYWKCSPKPIGAAREAKLAYMRAHYERTRKPKPQPCKTCKVAPRYHPNASYCAGCKDSSRKRVRTQANARYRERHPDRVVEQARRTRAKHRAKVQATFREWRLRNLAYVQARLVEWRESNSIHIKVYSALRREALTVADIPPENLAEICEAYEAAEALGMEVDHIIPLAGCRDCGAQGRLLPENIQLLNRSENASKNNRCQACWDQWRNHG